MSAISPSTDTRAELAIELAGPDDFALVDELVRVAYEHDYGPRDRSHDELHRSEVRATRFEVWVARARATGELVGTVTTSRDGGERLVEDARDDEVEFRLLAVSPAARRRGVGAALTQHVIDLARSRGRAGVSLKSAPNMLGAHRLYESLGFQRDPDRDGLIIGGVKQFDLYAYRIDVESSS